MLDPGAAYVNVSGAFPNVLGINASGPSATDGFEFIANFVNDNNLGIHQMMLDHAGLVPDGVVESASASQIKEALQKGFGGAPGMVHQWHLDDDPSVSGHRCLPLNGQGVLRASYSELDTVAYVGDANNAAVAAAGGGWYRADDAAGTSPNIVGVYLILPETRGYIPRGLDSAASVDPDGASRYLGDIQLDAGQGHNHNYDYKTGQSNIPFTPTTYRGASDALGTNDGHAGPSDASNTVSIGTEITDGVNGTPRISSETRMVNFSTNFVVWY